MVGNSPVLLVIGPVPPPVGGTRVLTDEFRQFLSSTGREHVLLDLEYAQGNPIRECWLFLRSVFSILFAIPKYDAVVLFATTRVAMLLGPIVLTLCRLFSKPCALKKFGGRFDLTYDALNPLAKWWIRNTTLKMDVVFFETQALVAFFSERVTGNFVWNANCRNLSGSPVAPLERQPTGKFAYLGHVRECKGIETIRRCASHLPENFQIDIYGPVTHGYSIEGADFFPPRVDYKGSVEPANVISTLMEYDALLFPTHCKTEGYPGVILEAFGAGIPVVASRWNAIPEIVEDGTSGLLIEARNEVELANAMKRLYDQDLLSRLRRGSREQGRKFDAKEWFREMVDRLDSLQAAKVNRDGNEKASPS